MAKLTWSEYALKEAIKTIKAECTLHTSCSQCPLVEEDDCKCMLDRNPCDVDVEKIYPDKEY